MSRALTKYKNKVASLCCLICAECGFGEGTPAILHHPRVDVGGAQRESDWLVIPLCPEHHVGKTGIHTLGPMAFWSRFGFSEIDLLALVTQRVNS